MILTFWIKNKLVNLILEETVILDQSSLEYSCRILDPWILGPIIQTRMVDWVKRAVFDLFPGPGSMDSSRSLYLLLLLLDRIQSTLSPTRGLIPLRSNEEWMILVSCCCCCLGNIAAAPRMMSLNECWPNPFELFRSTYGPEKGANNRIERKNKTKPTKSSLENMVQLVMSRTTRKRETEPKRWIGPRQRIIGFSSSVSSTLDPPL